MDARRLRELLAGVRSGQIELDAALRELERLPFTDLGYARVDHHRALRQGVPEVVLGEAKTPEEIAGIAQELIRGGHNVLITRLAADKAKAVCERMPGLTYAERARVATYEHEPVAPRPGVPVPVITAGTSDIPVAEEALVTLRMFGIQAERIFDVGVAGIHRVVGHLDLLASAPAVIVVAGMEGALASVVGGLVGAPVIAVPTSVGYGVSLGGLTALFGMLTSCASGVTVVNIDNGFGAGYMASIINRE